MSLEDILSAIEKPLTFAAKNNFASLSHIKNLSEVVTALVDKVLSDVNNLNHRESLSNLKRSFSSFASLDELQKRDVILQSLNIIKELREIPHAPETKKQSPVSYYESNKMLKSPIQYVKGVGPKLSEVLLRRNIATIDDALYFLPRTYLDRRKFNKIADLRRDEDATVMGVIISTGRTSSFKRKNIFEIAVDDGSQILIAKWFNYSPQYQTVLKNKFKNGQKVILSGRVADFRFQKEIHHPDIEVIDEDEVLSPDFQSIIPVYPLSEGLHQKTVRKIMRNVIENYAQHAIDALPDDIRKEYALVSIHDALTRVHFPDNNDNFNSLENSQSRYHRRLVFEELFFLELGLAMKKKGFAIQSGIALNIPREKVAQFIAALPFTLTNAQKRTLEEMLADMAQPFPMNRLIQGDVGSGKTVVALIASLAAIWNGYQSVFMAPTEILAEQHYATINALTRHAGISIVRLTGSQPKSERESILERIRSGAAQLIIGTHAVIQESVEFYRLGFAVIDEQHKFGVMQRAQLKKKGVNPDVLVMTATPIPRTLGLTVYGDLDLSIIDELPPGRTPVITRVYHEKNREDVYAIVRQELKKGNQTFIVYPLVEESEKIDLKDATNMAHHLKQDIFPEYRVGLIHGKMPAPEKERIMQEFQANGIHILVATTVIEVGIDIPNASLMIIEHAERFGLSQLHQLRGRVGRGTAQSLCILLAQYRKSDDARRRLAVMEHTNDGFKIA
ncbi:MAG: ATP-dependent DNA helicase RecG [Proteobacteria bacterium]|nr:ATP-dependent DNA helicase RecG [Pseudomonadota bacterium]